MFRTLAAASLLTVACAMPLQQAAAQDAVAGGIFGGAAGAIIGGALGGRGGAVAGAIIGGTTGAAIAAKASAARTVTTGTAMAATSSAPTAPGSAWRRSIAAVPRMVRRPRPTARPRLMARDRLTARDRRSPPKDDVDMIEQAPPRRRARTRSRPARANTAPTIRAAARSCRTTACASPARNARRAVTSSNTCRPRRWRRGRRVAWRRSPDPAGRRAPSRRCRVSADGPSRAPAADARRAARLACRLIVRLNIDADLAHRLGCLCHRDGERGGARDSEERPPRHFSNLTEPRSSRTGHRRPCSSGPPGCNRHPARARDARNSTTASAERC